MTVTLPVRLITGAMLLSGLSACGDKPADKPTETAAVTPAPVAATPAEPLPAAPVVEAPAVETPAAAPAPTPAPAGVTYASLTGDAAKGEKVFGQCKTCHVAEKGVNRVGPSLLGRCRPHRRQHRRLQIFAGQQEQRPDLDRRRSCSPISKRRRRRFRAPIWRSPG